MAQKYFSTVREYSFADIQAAPLPALAKVLLYELVQRKDGERVDLIALSHSVCEPADNLIDAAKALVMDDIASRTAETVTLHQGSPWWGAPWAKQLRGRSKMGKTDQILAELEEAREQVRLLTEENEALLAKLGDGDDGPKVTEQEIRREKEKTAPVSKPKRKALVKPAKGEA